MITYILIIANAFIIIYTSITFNKQEVLKMNNIETLSFHNELDITGNMDARN